MKTYQAIASKINAIGNCIKSGNEEWRAKHEEAIDEIMKTAPSGSGVDSGISFLPEESSEDKLVFSFGFHHLNENGYYDGWTEHKAIVKPSLMFGYTLTITGRNRNDIKEYLHQTVSMWLEEEIDL
jgi:hypothetical protein